MFPLRSERDFDITAEQRDQGTGACGRDTDSGNGTVHDVRVCLECEDGSAEAAAGEQQTHQRWTRPQSSCRSSSGTKTQSVLALYNYVRSTKPTY